MTSEDRPESDRPDHDSPTLPPSGHAFDEPTMPLSSSMQNETVSPAPKSLGNDTSAGDSAPGAPKSGDSAAGENSRYFGDYELLEEIARGGMGVVFKARQVNLNRIVALKMILAGQFAGDEDVQRFYTEAEAAAQLDHPGIVPIFDIGDHEGQHYFSMGYIEGQSLAQRIAEEPLEPSEAAGLTRKICDAISYAHERNVIHRDLKPANILLDASGQPKVTDFGLAKKTEAESNLTGTGQILGTPAYMPPEQAAGKVDEVGTPADIYSLGAILYCLLTGQPPFQAASPMETLLQVMGKEPTAPRQMNAAVPVDLETICMKCLDKEPSRRYESAAALSADLERYLADEPIEARPSSSVYKLWRKAKRNRTTSLALAAAVLAVVGGSIFFYQSQQTANRERAAQQSAKDAQEALQRVQSSQGIQQLAIIPFRNLSGNPAEDWLGAGFASVLQTKLSGSGSLKVVGKGPMEEAASALGIASNEPMDEAESLRFGRQLLVNHVITGEFQRVAEQIQVSARLINTKTGAVDRGGMQVRGAFADVFDLQTDLANQCLAQLGVIETTPKVASGQDAQAELAAAPAASVDAWMFLGKGQQSLANGDYEQAIRFCERATEEDPKLWKAFRTRAIAHTKVDQLEESLKAFQKALEINPDDWTSKAYFNLLSGRIVEGMAAMDKAEESGEADLDLLKISMEIAIAVNAATGGGIKLEKLRSAIETHPDDQELLVLLASAQSAMGEIDAAIETLEGAVKLRPRRSEAHLLLSIAYETQGRTDEAAAELEIAERYRPEGIRGFREFGEVYSNAGKRPRAIQELMKALEIDPNDSTSHLELGELYLVTDLGKALGHYESALIQRPNALQVHSVLCRLFNLIGQDAKLEEYASRWVKADPDSYEAHQYLRLAYLKTGKEADAASVLATLEGLTPRHKTFFVMTANTLIQTSMTAPAMIDEAILVLQKGVSAYPEDPMLPGMLGFSEALKLWHQAEWQQASESFETLVSVFDGSDMMAQAMRRDCATFLATCYEQMDRIPEAADQMRRAAENGPELVVIPKAFSLFDKAEKHEYAIEFARKLLPSRPNDLKLQRDLIRSYALAGNWDAAKRYFAELPSKTADDLVRQIHVGVALADWMERRGEISPGSGARTIEKLLQKTGSVAADLNRKEMIAAHTRWARFPQQFLILGPFESTAAGLDEPLPPEQSFSPDQRYEGYESPYSGVRELYWRGKSGRAGDLIDLESLNPEKRKLIAFLSTHLLSPEEQTVTLVVGGSDKGKVWLNGEELSLSRRSNGDAAVSVDLKKGANWLLMKTMDLPTKNPLAVDGRWSAMVTAVDANGWPAKIRWSTDPDVQLGEARAHVHWLETRLLAKEDVITRVSNDASLSQSKRALSLEIAERLPDDDKRIDVKRVQEFLTGDTVNDRAVAVRVAGNLCRANPSNHDAFGALAIACYADGRYETAIKASKRAWELSNEQQDVSHPVYLAIQAMAYHQLEDKLEAKSAFDQLRESLAELPDSALGQRALKEVTATLGN